VQKQEFEKLAMRNDAKIGLAMYSEIELFYMSENEYHRFNGGIFETKQKFVNRVFNGKCNTPKTIAEKIANEAIKENRFALRGNQHATDNRLNEMDLLIKNHINGILKYNL
jgi:hypothetical protein